MAKSIVVISAGLSQPSSTRLLADRLSEAVIFGLGEAGEQATVTVVELREHAHAITDALLTGFAPPALAAALAEVEAADAVIAVTPIFTSSYSGLFKSFFDIMEPKLLAGKPVLLAATGGTARHSLALEYGLRPLFAYLQALVVPTAVFAASEDWGSSEGHLSARITRAATELVGLLRGSAPVHRREEEVIPFAEQLAALARG